MTLLETDLERCNRWVDKASVLLGGKPDAESLKAMYSQAPRIRTKESRVIKTRLDRAVQWEAEAQTFLARVGSTSSAMYYDELVNLVAKGKELPVKLAGLARFESWLVKSNQWLARAEKLFCKKGNTVPLAKLLAVPEPSAYRAHLKILRERKQAEVKQSDPKYCVCRSGIAGFMVCCELCEGWYHGRCVGFTETMSKAGARFICPGTCAKTRRPKIDAVQKLLAAATKLEIKHNVVRAVEDALAAGRRWDELVDSTLARPDSSVGDLRELLIRGDSLELARVERTKRLATRIDELEGAEVGGAVEICTCGRSADSDPDRIHCHNCQIWYHWECVGLDKNDAESMDVYTCPKCLAGEKPERLYCICKQPYTDESEDMIECSKCSDWFHLDCVWIALG